MRCLILGGTGFLGVNLTNLLINLGNEVTVFSSGANKDFLDYGLKAKFVCGDFKDRNLIDSLSRNGFDYIFHLISTTKPSNLDPYSEFTDNVLPTIIFLESVKKSSELKKIIFISSGGTVYGIPEKLPITEEHDCNPISLYGIQKLTIENLFFYYHHQYGLNYQSIRLSNPYGPGQPAYSNQGVIANFLRKAILDEPIEIWGTGNVIRDFIYISDVLEACKACMNYSGDQTVFNIGSSQGASLIQIIGYIENILNKKVEIVFKEGRKQDVPANVLDISLARRELKWRPEIELPQGIRLMFNSWSASKHKFMI